MLVARMQERDFWSVFINTLRLTQVSLPLGISSSKPRQLLHSCWHTKRWS